MIKKIFFILIMGPLSLLVGCKDDLSDSLRQYRVEVALIAKAGGEVPIPGDGIVRFTDLSSGRTTLFSYPLPSDATLMPGLYDVGFSGNAEGMEYFGIARSVNITSNGVLIRLEIYQNRQCDDLIISEIFFTGTLRNSGNQYYGDDYVKLYNNTDHVVYADGLTLFETKFLTTEKRAYTPDLMESYVTAHALYTIPGAGRDHPVAPGEYLLLADTGIDHRAINPNSFDLSHADWEWYDISGVPSNLDINSPAVPDLDKWYCYTNSFFLLHNRGYRAVGIARLGDKEAFLRDNWYSYDYEIVTAAGTFPMTGEAYKIPNEKVADVVNCSIPTAWQWNVTDPSLDRGRTYCALSSDDKTRYGLAVRRKLLYIDINDRPVFQDTNNSTDDFNPRVVPSEAELRDGTIITYDGITPIADNTTIRK